MIFEGCIIKLASIIRGEYPRNPKTAYYILPEKISYILLSDLAMGSISTHFIK